MKNFTTSQNYSLSPRFYNGVRFVESIKARHEDGLTSCATSQLAKIVHMSFPQKRESSLSINKIAVFNHWIPAFARMTRKKTPLTTNHQPQANLGFTLVELAIVIVIIGLLVGGVMQGQELITQSKVRSQIKQVEEFNAALAIFKSKYDALPGDLVAPQRFNFYNGASYGGTANYLGNGVINNENGLIAGTSTNIEPQIFFVHLGQAKLIKNLLPHTNNTSNSCYSNANYSRVVGCQFPEGKIGKGGFFAYTARDGNLYYFFGASIYDPNIFNPYEIWSISPNPVISPAEAFLIDNKIDDGNPSMGNVLATRTTNSNSTNLTNDITLNNCLGATSQVYNISEDRLLCRMSIKAVTN